MEPMPAWKPRVVLASVTQVEIDEAPSPLHAAIRAFVERGER